MSPKEFLDLKNVTVDSVETFSPRLGFSSIDLPLLLQEFLELKEEKEHKTELICNYCNNELSDSQLFNERCLKCDKKTLANKKKENMKIKALFKGVNSLGYREGSNYVLSINFKENGNVIIESDHKGSLCIYTSFKTFLNNWTDVSELEDSKEKDKSLYLIQNKDAGFLGNAIYFWAEGHNGYTANTKRAHKFTYDEAKSICLGNPEKNKAWKFDYIKSNKGTHITTDSQYLDRNEIVNFKD